MSLRCILFHPRHRHQGPSLPIRSLRSIYHGSPHVLTLLSGRMGQLWAPSRRAGLIPRSKPCVVQEILTLDLCRTTLRKTPQSITDNGGRGRWGFNCALVQQSGGGRGALPPSLLTTFIFKGTTSFIAWLLFNSHNFMIPLQF